MTTNDLATRLRKLMADRRWSARETAPGVVMLCELAKFVASFGDPSAKPRK